jgi:filamentous hemagglutinin family protein
MKRTLFKAVLVSSLCLASSFSIVNRANAAVVSNNLPVPVYVNGATLNYSTGLNIGKTAGNLNSTVQTQAATAADGSAKLNIDLGTTTKTAILNYNSFNVAEGKAVNFNFGATGQSALNRVTGAGAGYASKILGNLTQTGQDGAVFIINPNGLLFGKNSSVNVGAFTASTLNYTSDTLNNTSDRKIILSRAGLTPNGIYLESGSKITTKNGALFASSGIADLGANITAGSKNVQFITGDGVTFKFADNTNSESVPVAAEDVVSSTILPSQVAYSNGYKDVQHTIIIKGGTVSGQNVVAISGINKLLTTPFEEIVNIDGIINAGTLLGSKGGEIRISAQNNDNSGKTNAGLAGVKINGNLTAGVGSSGSVTINADKFSMGDNAQISTDSLNISPTTANKPVLLGDGTLNNAYAISNTSLLDKINSKNITVGNKNTISDITGTAFKLGVKGNNPVNMTLSTTGKINSALILTNSGSSLNFTNPNEVNIAVTNPYGMGNVLNSGQINSTGNVSFDLNGIMLNTGNITGQNIFIRSNLGSISTGSIAAKEDIDLLADSSLKTADLTAGYSAKVCANSINTGNVKANGNFTAEYVLSNGVIINSKNITVKNIDCGWDMNLKGSLISSENITAGGNLIFNADYDSSADSKIKAGNLTAGSDLILLGKTISTENLSSGTAVSIVGNLDFNNKIKSSISTKDIKARWNIYEAGIGPILNGNLTTDGIVELHALSDGIDTADIKAGGYIYQTANDHISNGNLTAGSNAVLEAYSGRIFTKDINAGGYISETAGLDIVNGNLTAKSNINLSTDFGITTGTLSANPYIYLRGGTYSLGKTINGKVIYN